MITLNNQLPLESSEVAINKGEWLTDALKREKYHGMIPTNVILEKTETGIGATYSELITPRNSIIIEPNVPVIKGKCKREDKYRPVHEGITAKNIEKYLKREDIEFKKILTTPEGYGKIQKAAANLNINLHKDFFLLFDECEKITQDTKFRPNISIPIKDFFSYDGKAFVSATPIQPSNPAFQQNNFKILQIKPTYDYKKDATLIVTRSWNRKVKESICTLMENSKLPICVFFSSTYVINQLITTLQNENIINSNNYKVFCSSKSVKELKSCNISKSSENIELPLARINFFTSRFFSAVDIVAKRCDILVLSDKKVVHSLIDPFTGSIQIQGRFRRTFTDGRKYNSLTFITNIADNIKTMTDEEVTIDIKVRESNYYQILEKYNRATSDTEKNAHSKELKRMRYNDLFDIENELNYFAIDNLYNTERVKRYYKSLPSLKKAYKDTQYFNIELIDESQELGDDDILDITKATLKGRWRIIVETIARLEPLKQEEEGIHKYEEAIEKLQQLYAKDYFIVDAYLKFGTERLEALGYNKKKIIEELEKEDLQKSPEERLSQGVLDDVYSEFVTEMEEGRYIPKADFKRRLGEIFTAHEIPFKQYGDNCADKNINYTITDKTVDEFFEATTCNSKKPPSFKLKAFKFKLG